MGFDKNDNQTVDIETHAARGEVIFYRRVSTHEQNLDRQNIPGVQFNKIFDETYTGTKKKRPKMDEMLNYVRNNDVVYFYSFDRCARSLKDLQEIIETIVNKGAKAVFYNNGENITFDPTGSDKYKNFQMQLLGAVAELENEIRRERQLEGIAIAKQKEKYNRKLTNKQRDEIAAKYNAGDFSYADLANEYDVSRVTIGNIVKANKAAQGK